MSDFPDFTQEGYQVEKELGYNSSGGRITYLARKIKAENSQTDKGQIALSVLEVY